MSGHSDSHGGGETSSDVKNVSRTQSSEIIAEGDEAKQRVQGIAFKIAALIIFALVVTFGKSCYAERKAKEAEQPQQASSRESASDHAPTVHEDPEYPRSGEGYPTKKVGLKCWLDPRKTYTRPNGPARYCLAEVPDMCFDDTAGARVEVNSNWQAMPAGKYIVTPLKADKIYFRWCTDCSSL